MKNGNVIENENINETNGSQTFETETGMTWRIWDFDGNTLRIIGDPTSTKLTLQGTAGYNNGVWAMDEICRKCYSNDEPGVTVRNLRRSDIEAVSNYDYTRFEHEQNDWKEVTQEESGKTYIHYGEEKNYTAKYLSPKMWSDHDMNWTYKYDKGTKTGEKSCIEPWEQSYGSDEETGRGSTNKDTKFKQSYYCHNYKNSEFYNSIYYNLVFRDGMNNPSEGFWLATRDVSIFSSWCVFGFSSASGSSSGGFVAGTDTFDSEGGNLIRSKSLRPFVSINLKSSGYKLVENNDGSDAEFIITYVKE